MSSDDEKSKDPLLSDEQMTKLLLKSFQESPEQVSDEIRRERIWKGISAGIASDSSEVSKQRGSNHFKYAKVLFPLAASLLLAMWVLGRINHPDASYLYKGDGVNTHVEIEFLVQEPTGDYRVVEFGSQKVGQVLYPKIRAVSDSVLTVVSRSKSNPTVVVDVEAALLRGGVNQFVETAKGILAIKVENGETFCFYTKDAHAPEGGIDLKSSWDIWIKEGQCFEF